MIICRFFGCLLQTLCFPYIMFIFTADCSHLTDEPPEIRGLHVFPGRSVELGFLLAQGCVLGPLRSEATVFSGCLAH